MYKRHTVTYRSPFRLEIEEKHKEEIAILFILGSNVKLKLPCYYVEVYKFCRYIFKKLFHLVSFDIGISCIQVQLLNN